MLVRRVRQGQVWHPTNDNLAGTALAYGTYGSPTLNATFGIPFSTLISPSTEFLFVTGELHCKPLTLVFPHTSRFAQAIAASG